MAEIAIVGLAGRFPGADTPMELWENLCAGKDAVVDVSEEELRAARIDPSIWSRADYVRKSAFPKGIENFDSRYFGFTPREASLIDPQHRLMLTIAHEALQDAGYDPFNCPGTVSIFAGCTLNTYLLTQLMSDRDLLRSIDIVQLNLASSGDFLATRIAYKLNLKGVSHSVQCACSTSLVATHLACQQLLGGDCDMALAGGVSLNLHLRHGYTYKPGGMFSKTGHCRAFDADADGTIFGNGAGMVVMKRLSDALRDRDHVYAIIKGSAVNNDGDAKVGFAAPSVEGQALAIAEAIANAGVTPESIGYVETHGTGTAIGDPIEIDALRKVFARAVPTQWLCPIGSIKSNLGHLDCAAGVTSLIKSILALQHRRIPASLHYSKPNPLASIDESPFYVNTRLSEWPDRGGPLRAGVSAFGVGGTNAHVVLEEARSTQVSVARDEGAELLVFSGLSPELCAEAGQRIEDYISSAGVSFGDAAFTLAVGRTALPFRTFRVCSPMGSERDPQIHPPEEASDDPSVTLLFSEHAIGTQKTIARLTPFAPEFNKTIRDCLNLFEGEFESPKISKLLIEDVVSPEYEPAFLFTFQYSLYRQFFAWGIRPKQVLGYGIGEYAAACAAGAVSLQWAVHAIASRMNFASSSSPIQLLTVPLSEEEVLPYVGSEVKLYAINSRSQCVLSGPSDSIEMIEGQLLADGIHARKSSAVLGSRCASEELAAEITRSLDGGLRSALLSTDWISSTTGQTMAGGTSIPDGYWIGHMNAPVRFHESVDVAIRSRDSQLIDMGPGGILTNIVRKNSPTVASTRMVVACNSETDVVADLLRMLGILWSRGVEIDWDEFYAYRPVRRLSLPPHRLREERCWIEKTEDVENGIADPAIPATQEINPNPASAVQNRPSLKQAYVAPVSGTERRLIAILEPILGIRPLGTRDNFFDLGADSLTAVSVVTQLQEVFGVTISPVDLYEATDVRLLALLIDSMATVGSPLDPQTSFST